MAANPPTVPVPVPDAGDTTAAAIHPEDPDDEWVVDDSKGGIRVRTITAGLVALALLGGGFWGGVVAEKHHGTGSSGSSLAGELAALRAARAATGTGTGSGRGTAGAGAGSGFPSGFGASGAATRGTVIGVQGDVLEISDPSGNIVKVSVPSTAPVTRTAASSLAGLQIGDTVVVIGSTGANGTVSAIAVRATAQGAAGAAGAGSGTVGGFGAGGG
jgi:hypothetical protein